MNMNRGRWHGSRGAPLPNPEVLTDTGLDRYTRDLPQVLSANPGPPRSAPPHHDSAMTALLRGRPLV